MAQIFILVMHGSDSSFFKGGVNFNHPPWRVGSEKLKKEKGVELWCRGWSSFAIKFFQGLSFLHLEIFYSLQNCVIHLKKKHFFSTNIVLRKKDSLSCLKINHLCVV